MTVLYECILVHHILNHLHFYSLQRLQNKVLLSPVCIAFLSISNYTMWEIEKALTTPTAVLSTSIWWRATTTCSSSSTTFWSRLSSEKSSQINHGWSWARCHWIYSSLWNCSGNNNPIFLGEKIIEEKVILRCQIWFAEKHMSIGFYFCTFFF